MKFSIRYKTLLSYGIVLILAFAAQVMIFTAAREFIYQQVVYLHREKAVHASDFIKQFSDGIELDLVTLGRNYFRLDESEPTEIIHLMNLTLQRNRFFKEISILTPSGRELVKVNRYTGTDTKLDFEIPTGEFVIALAGKQAVSKVFYAQQSKIPLVDYYSPLTTEKGIVAGVIKSRVQLDGLWDLVSQIRVGDTGYAYIVDDEGRLIAHPDIDLVLANPNYGGRKIISALSAVPTPSLTPDDYLYKNERNIPVIANGVTIPFLNWAVIVEQPVSEAFSRLNLLQNLFYSTMFGSIVLAFAASILLSRSLTRPILRLQTATRSMTAGDLSHEVDIRTGDEVEQLARSFNIMASRLRVSISELRGNIKELQDQKSRLDVSTRELEKEKQLVEIERRRLEVVLAGINDGVIAVDKDRMVTFINPAAVKITGFTQFGSGSLTDIFRIFDKDGELLPDVYCSLKPELPEGVGFEKDNLKMITSGNKTYYVNLTVSRIKDRESMNLGGIITFHDVTGEQELEQMKLDFVSMSAHELRTPLTTVMGYISFLQEPGVIDKLSNVEKEYVNRVSISANRLNELIKNLLAVAKIEQGKMQVEPVTLDLPGLVSRVIADYQNLAQSKGLSLSFTPPSGNVLPVLADAMRVEEILTNLIGNAITYTPHGSVAIGIRQNGDFVETFVTDTGQGIPESALPHLFTKFYRIQGALESGSKGTGLGLFICKNIVTAHGGKIWVESAEGKGSTFTFSLPVARPAAGVVA